jgi:hypothetical protein
MPLSVDDPGALVLEQDGEGLEGFVGGDLLLDDGRGGTDEIDPLGRR